MTTIIPVTTKSDIHDLADMASNIWNEYFPSIIGQAQVDYMVEKFQSVNAITSQINDDYEYYFICHDDNKVGYLGLVPVMEKNVLQISKFYLLKQARRNGYGKSVIIKVLEMAKSKGFDRLYLTVNKYNAGAISAYEKMGFQICGDIVMDIEGGFVMDDYELEKPVTN